MVSEPTILKGNSISFQTEWFYSYITTVGKHLLQNIPKCVSKFVENNLSYR